MPCQILKITLLPIQSFQTQHHRAPKNIANMQKLFVSIAMMLVCGQFATAAPQDAAAEIRSLSSDVQEDGSYNYQYETSNGIVGQESGLGGHYASGSSQYYSPEGQFIQLTYTADENGFQPNGEHLPTPPPIPEAILKALEYIRTHPNQEERQGGGQHQQQQQRQPTFQQFQQQRPFKKF